MASFSKPQTVEIKDVAVTRVKRYIFLYYVTPCETIILILFQFILGKEEWVIFGTIVRVLELSSIIEKEVRSSEIIFTVTNN